MYAKPSVFFEASVTLSQATGPQSGPRLDQKLGKEIARLFVPNGAQDEAATTFSNQESMSGEAPSAKSIDFVATDTLSQATGPQDCPG